MPNVEQIEENEDEKTIEITNERSVDGDKAEVFAPIDGVFIATARFAQRFFPTMIYDVVKRVSPEEFLAAVGRKKPSVDIKKGLKADKISDLCVNAFDGGVIVEGDCLWLYQHSDGRIIMQHST